MILNSKIFINEGNNLLKMIGGGQEHSSGGALESIIRDVSWSGEYSRSLTPTLYFSGDFPQAPPNKSKNPDRILGLYEHYSEIGRTLLDYWHGAKEKSLAALSSVKNFDYKGISRNVINYFKTSSTKRKVTLGVGALAIAAALAYGGYSCLTPGVVQPGLTSTPPPFYTPTPSPSLTPDLIPTPPLLESLETVVATSIPTVHPFATQIPTPALTPGPIPTVHPFATQIPTPALTPGPIPTVHPFDTPIPLPPPT